MAFDCVCHKIVLEKYLEDGALKWIMDYLHNRQQQVLVNNTKSRSAAIEQGVPQGSIQGPLLYTVYANNIPSTMKSKIALYADDTVLYTASKNSVNIF